VLTGNDVLAVDRVSVSFPGRAVLQDVSFRLQGGVLCGLIGANGSGKTTLLRAILGLHRPSAGSIRIERRNGLPAVGYVPQKLVLDPFLPVRAWDMVALGLDGHRLGVALPSRARTRTIEAMLAAVDATGFAQQRLGRLSGGQQQRVLIAHALVCRPRLLLLDEPLANLDIRSVAETVALLCRLSAEHRISVLVSAHDMNPLLPAMDRIVYLASGRAASGSTDEVVRSEVLSELYGYHVDVLRVHGRVLVVAPGAEAATEAVARDPAHAVAVP
jgi:zinc/manganese transport system ATP-binding protein